MVLKYDEASKSLKTIARGDLRVSTWYLHNLAVRAQFQRARTLMLTLRDSTFLCRTASVGRLKMGKLLCLSHQVKRWPSICTLA